MKPSTTLIAEFDSIADALIAADRRDVLTPAERTLLDRVPVHAKRALDVGCGDGVLARALADRGIAVLGIDMSPGMIAVARGRTDSGTPIEFRVADIMTDALAESAFDVVISVSMVHHLPLDEIVPRLAGFVAPGGVLLIQDVVTRPGVRNLPVNAVAALRSRIRRLFARSRTSARVARLYEAHGEGEVYLEPTQVTPAYRALLPDARVFHHLEWRYSVEWHRPV